MVSDAKKKRDAAKKAKAGKPGSAKESPAVSTSASELSLASLAVEPSNGHVDPGLLAAAQTRTVTGVLTSRPTSRDIKIDGFSMGLNGVELIQDCSIELTIGRRYGLLGSNGSGKSNFLQCLAAREVPIPEHMDLYHLHQEAEPSDRTALEAVVDHINEEIARLNALEERIMNESGPDDERLQEIYERLEELDPSTFETTAAKLLHGLGLEEYLKTYKKCLVLVSHSQDFLNGVCTHIIWLTQNRLTYYTGNYDTYVKTVQENEVIQQKKHEKEQDDIKHIKQFIASCGTYSNLVKQAKSKQKILDKMEADGLTPPVVHHRPFAFSFPDCDKLPPPVLPFISVSFAYSGREEDMLYRDLEFGVDCDSRIALVGPNGAGKSTLLKLMTGDIQPTRGEVKRHSHLSIGRYHQHSVDVLDESMRVLDFFMHTYPNDPLSNPPFKRELDEWRAYVGRFGITGRMQASKIGELSDGVKSRLVFAMICMARPNMLLLDEPTNHLDIECIDSLADAIKRFRGGLVLVSHDFRLIDQVAEEIWVCDKKTITTWKGDIRAYKQKLAKGVAL